MSQQSNGHSQVAINNQPLDLISQHRYSLFPHYLIGVITADINGRPGNASGALVSPNLVITAAHAVFDRKQEEKYKNIRFHLAPKDTFKIGEGIQVEEFSYPYAYRKSGNYKMYDYALLKLSKKIDLGNKSYFQPTIFGCSSCLSSENQ